MAYEWVKSRSRPSGPQQHVCVFLEWDTDGPDTVSLQLLRSGDVETNPGPRPGERCGDCGVRFSRQSREVQCGECMRWYCKTPKPGVNTTCAGYTRWKQSQMLEAGKPLKCRLCKGEDPRRREEENEGVEPGRCIGPNCIAKAKIRRRDPFLICSKCDGHFHVQKRCSEMTKGQLGTLDRSTWECPICVDKEAAKQTAEAQDETESRYKETKAKGKTLRILQLNIDSLLSKFDELKKFIEREKIDVFVIQETKMIRSDKLPKIPGYSIERQDRYQPKGKDKDRGGGLVTGVSEEYAKKRLVKFNIRGSRDHLTESLTVEIPTKNGEKIRVTNVYIPPANSEASRNLEENAETQVRGTSGNRGRGGSRGRGLGRGRGRGGARRGSSAPRGSNTRRPRQEDQPTTTRRSPLVSDGFDVRRWPTKEYDVILGDTNAHSLLWDDSWEKPDADERGRVIENWCASNNMAPINDGKPTRKCRKDGKGTAPDQAFVHASKLDKFTWEVVDDLSSDHSPIIITYQDQFPTINNKPTYKWNLKKAEWDKFAEMVEKNIPRHYAAKNLNKVEKRLRKAIIKAANKYIRKKKITPNVKCYLTPQVKEAIKKRNALSKKMGENRSQWVEACRETAELIRTEKEKCWKEYVEGLDRKSDAREIFRTARAIDGQAQVQQHKNEVLEVDGVSYIADADKAEQFAKTYREFSRLPSRKEDRVTKRKVREARKRARGSYTLQESEQDITAEEVLSVIRQAHNSKAAGMDDVPYEMMKHLGPRATEMMVHIYQRCWRGEGIPKAWRTALIKPLLKEGKDARETVSYRPISLTSCMGKILEKVVANRLIYVLEERNLLNPNQAGFRPGRSTTDQVWKLVQSASDNIHESSRKRTVATFFDYEKAYDKVWRDGLLSKMEDLEIPQRFATYVRHFLSGRKTRVEVNNTKSKEFTLKEGLPQGSSISPLLFLIFINDLPVDLDLTTSASLFADDTSTWRRDGKVRGSDRVMTQTEVDKITGWAKTWKMKVNGSKTKAMVASTSRKDRNWNPELEADGAPIELVQDYKFLGVKVSADLTFRSHVETVVDRCRKRNRVLKCMGTKKWGCSLETQRTIYVQYIRPALEYASPSWVPWISKTDVKKLQTVQNEALRSIADLALTCPVDFLHLETGIDPLQDRFRKNNEMARERHLRMAENDARRQQMEKKATVKLKTRQGLRHATRDYPAEANFERATTRSCLPPWRGTKLKFDRVPLEKKKEEYSEEELRRRTEEKIEGLEVEAILYTDGSTSGTQENGGAGLYVQRRDGTEEKMSWAAGRYCSSYGAEGVAFLRAIEWAEENQVTPIAICTDSLSLQQALQRDDWRDADDWIGEIKEAAYRWGGDATVLWIPSHCGVTGNEIVDELADVGAKMAQNGIPVTHATAKARIKRVKWEVKHARAQETFGERRKPKFEVESAWTRGVRSLFSRLRTGHAPELKQFKYKIEAEDDPYCECGEEETIKHVLCECPRLARARALGATEQLTVGHMTSDPERCRHILSTRFPDLKAHTHDAEEAQGVGDEDPVVALA